ncbi:hypothetical protein DYS74_18040 [Sinirhodobacter hankyongi]|uniref:Uncharacterized protein n=1 Tax=Paenirhodobacter hankyongi TaxID=2294033 RepID=A0A421BJ54_9RHOB|nr:hypothetical protein DYS74_18040 [Sinirhodobacter hankyongi]
MENRLTSKRGRFRGAGHVGDELPKDEALANLTVWLRHLEAHPEHDVDCTLEVRVPLSYLTRLMIRGEREDKPFPVLVRELLEKNGYGDCEGMTAN